MWRVRTAISGLSGGPQLGTHYWLAENNTDASVQACVDRVQAFWAAMASSIRLGYVLVVQGAVDEIDPGTGALLGGKSLLSRTVNGGDPGESLPYQTQGMVRWTTSTIVRGRRLQGRTFIPAPSEPSSGAGLPGTTYVSALNAGATALLSNALLRPVIWSRPLRDAQGTITSPGSVGIVLAGVGLAEWRVLRSRR